MLNKNYELELRKSIMEIKSSYQWGYATDEVDYHVGHAQQREHDRLADLFPEKSEEEIWKDLIF